MKRFDVDKYWGVLAVAAGLMLVATAEAQLPAATKTTRPIISDFRVPEFDENGVKKSEVMGRQAEIMPNGQINITDLRILMFKDGQVEATIIADQCTFDRKDKWAFSNSSVSLDRDSMRVTGRGFRWSAVMQRIEILNEARVVLKNTHVWKEGGKK